MLSGQSSKADSLVAVTPPIEAKKKEVCYSETEKAVLAETIRFCKKAELDLESYKRAFERANTAQESPWYKNDWVLLGIMAATYGLGHYMGSR